MYYISRILLDNNDINSINSNLDKSRVMVDLHDTVTQKTKLVHYSELTGNEFGVVGDSLYKVTDDLWKFLDYVDKPELINGDLFSCINAGTDVRKIRQGEYLAGGRHIVVFGDDWMDFIPVDENCIFWIHTNANIISNGNRISVNLLDLYLRMIELYTITDKTEAFFSNRFMTYRLFLNKDIIRFITKLKALRE